MEVKNLVNPYRRGRIAEKKVVNYLRQRGFRNIRRSKGSRGPADIYATKNNTKFYIQVKSGTARPTRDEIRKLRKLAKERHGVAAVIHRKDGEIEWKFFGRWG